MLAPSPKESLPRVLVVDDEETIRTLLVSVVTRAGGCADAARSGLEAKDLLATSDYDCVVVDKNLPDVSGIHLLSHIKQCCPRTEVLIVTGYANMDSAIEALRLGAFDYITKPFDVTTVAHRLRLAFERRRMAEDLERMVSALRAAHAHLAESQQEVHRAYLEAVLRLSIAAEYRDDGALGHIRRISRLAGILARAVEATDQWVENIVFAAPLHDIGKIAVPDAILRKPGPLTDAERAIVKEHVVVGGRILEGTQSNVLALAREIVLTHHERWDGAGYPAGLRATEIPLGGRIVALCDAFDALATDRVYRKALPFNRAVDEIRALSGRWFDETLVAAFLDRLSQIRAVLEERETGAVPLQNGSSLNY